MDRPNKHVGNASDVPLTITELVAGQALTVVLEPGEGKDVPLSDDEFAQYQVDQKAATPVPAAVPLGKQITDAIATLPPDQAITGTQLSDALAQIGT